MFPSLSLSLCPSLSLALALSCLWQNRLLRLLVPSWSVRFWVFTGGERIEKQTRIHIRIIPSKQQLQRNNTLTSY